MLHSNECNITDDRPLVGPPSDIQPWRPSPGLFSALSFRHADDYSLSALERDLPKVVALRGDLWRRLSG
jgi:hypothetical protein